MAGVLFLQPLLFSSRSWLFMNKSLVFMNVVAFVGYEATMCFRINKS